MVFIKYDNVSLGEVQTLREVRQAGLTTFPIPGETQAKIYDLGGLTKRLTITTHYTGTTTEITNFLAQMDTWANARQGSGKKVELPFSRGTAFGDAVVENWSWETDSNLGGQTDSAVNLMVRINVNFIAGDIIDIF